MSPTTSEHSAPGSGHSGPSTFGPGAFEEALGSVDAPTAAALRELVRDTSYVEPRVVSHLRD